MESFVSQSLSSPAAAKAGANAERLAKDAIARARGTSSKAGEATRDLSQSEKLQAGAAEAVAVHQQAKTPEEQRIESLHKIAGRANMPLAWEFLGGAFSFVFGGIASKLGFTKVKVGLQAITGAPVKALRATPLNDLAQFPAHYWNAVGNYAQEASDKALVKHALKHELIVKSGWGPWAEISPITDKVRAEIGDLSKVKGMKGAESILEYATKRADSMKTAGEKFSQATSQYVGERMAQFSEHASPVLTPVKEQLRAGAAAVSEAKVVQQAGGAFGEFSKWRMGRHMNAHTNAMARAEAALTEKAPGFWANISQKVLRRAPQQAGVSEHFAEITADFAKAKSLKGAELISHMGDMAESLGKMTRDKTNPEMAKRAAHVMTSLTKAGNAAVKAHSFGTAVESGFGGMMKHAFKSAANMKVFGAMVVVGAVATIGATLLTAKKKFSDDDKLMDALVADMGDKNNPYLQEVRKATKSHNRGDMMTTGLSVVGEAALAATIASPAGAGGMGFALASSLPMVMGEPISANPVLASYQALNLAEQGKLQLTNEQKVLAVKQMVAVKPYVAAHGGIYSRVNSRMSQQIVNEGLKPKQIIQLLGDEKAFTARAEKAFNALQEEIKAKQAEADAAKAISYAQTSSKAEVVATKAIESAQASSKVVTQPHLAAAPATKITVGAMNAEHMGMMDNRQLGRV